MATGQLSGVIQNLRRSAFLHNEDGLTDGQLLDAFLAHADETAFEALVRRHSAMVWGVCLRVLGRSHDAEDAFQAAFLVLVKKADSIRPREMVGNWLYGVAYRTALKARSIANRRRAREKQVVEMPAKEVHDAQIWHDLQPLLDNELNRLADKYRVPVVLCDLEGKSQREAARQLGWPEGTLTTRLTRARQILAKRLTKHGLALSAGALALALSQNAASAAAPVTLVTTTIKAAALFAAGQTATTASVVALTEGVMKAMFLTKVKTVMTIVVAFAFVATGGGLVGHRMLAGQAAQPVTALIVQQEFEDEFTFFQEGGERRPAVNAPSLTGKIVALAADAKSFTIATPPANRGDEPGKQEVKLNDKTKLTFFGVGPDGAKLSEGLTAQVWLAEGSKETAATVNLQGSQATNRTADLTGRVTGVSKDGATLTFVTPGVRREEGKTVEVKIVAKTALTYSSIAKGGTKPAEGYSAAVWFEKGSKDTAAAIAFNGSDGPERGRVAQKISGAGKVVSVAKDGKTITLEMPPQNRGDEVSKVDYKIDDKTQITYQNVGPDGDRLTTGYLARVWLADGSKDTAATIMLADVPRQRHTSVRGTISGIAKDGKSFTLETPATERGGEAKKISITITEHTRVVYMGVGVGGARPTDGYHAEVTLEDGSTSNAHQVIFGASTGGTRR